MLSHSINSTNAGARSSPAFFQFRIFTLAFNRGSKYTKSRLRVSSNDPSRYGMLAGAAVSLRGESRLPVAACRRSPAPQPAEFYLHVDLYVCPTYDFERRASPRHYHWKNFKISKK